jgi:dienelactone hydrolase
VTTIVLFHSVFGLRPVELEAGERFRAAGHKVVTPDLYAGRSATSIEEGFELMAEIGWPAICERAERAAVDLPDMTVLAGISMGAGVVASLWPRRPHARGVLLLHALADIPDNVRSGLPAEVHVADRDSFAPPEQLTAWQATAARAGIAPRVFTYAGVGHFYTDASLPDYDAAAARAAWQRALAFLEAL